MAFKGYIVRVNSMRAAGMAIFPFVFIKNKKPGPVLLNHERIHLRQQLEMGFLPFYIWYLVEYLIRYAQCRDHYRAYRNISFEREAFCHESAPFYMRERRFWAFWRYL